MQEKPLKKIMELISDILDIDQYLTGEEYLKEFIKNIAINLDVKYALIGEPVDDSLTKIKTSVVWAGDGFSENFTYELKDTPCEIVLSGERVCIHPSNVSIDFPNDNLLQEMNIEAYIGAPVISKRDSKVSSILVLLDEKPMEDKEFFTTIVEFLALRASAEMEKNNIEDKLKAEIENRSQRLNDAQNQIKLLNTHLELKRSEKKFKILFEKSPIGMAMVDQDTGEFLEVNQSLLDSTGYTKKEFLDLSFWQITPKEYEDQEKQQQIELDEKGSFGPNFKEYIKKDGTRYPIKISGFKLTDTNSRRVVWGIIEDITKEKQHDIIYTDNKDLLEYITLENDLQKVLDKIVDLAEKHSPNTMCSILLLDKTKKHLLKGSAPSLPKFYNDAINGVEIGEKVGSCGSAVYKKQRVIVEHIDSHENWQPYLELTQKANLHSCWSEPIISSTNEVLGSFAIYSSSQKKPNEFELKLIETYANIASKAIEKDMNTTLIKDNEHKLEKLFNNSQSGLLYIDENRKLIRANQKFSDILGYDSPEEMIGLSMREFHLSEERFIEFGKNNFTTLITNQENFNIEYELKRKDGSSTWCEMSGKALDDNLPADLSKGVLWTINDISLKKRYELKLRENQTLLKSIISTIPDMLWVKDKDGVYLMCNEEFEKFFGASEDDIVGNTDYDFVDKELADFFRDNDKNAMENPDMVCINEEWVTYTTDERKVLLDTSKTAIKNDKNEIVGVLGIGHDVTQRFEREKELKDLNDFANSLTKSQQVLLSLFDKGESVLFRCDNNEKFTTEYVSQSIENLLGFPIEDYYKKELMYIDCIHKEDVMRVKEEIANAVDKKLTYFQHKPYRIITKDKQEKWVITSNVTQKDEEDNITHFIGYITDITEQIKSQEMMFHQSKIASLGEMLGNISHQWRQPLSVISTMATGTKLKKELNMLEDEEFYSNMDNINDKAQYLSATIDDFRNFFLSDTTSKQEIYLKNSIDKVLALVKDAYRSSNIKIVKNYQYEDAQTICNENLLIQGLINILNNAKDALSDIEDKEHQGYVFINLLKDNDDIVIEIKDNAYGIPKDVLPKIFEPYFTTKHQSQGTGIGLYMTNQIFSKHLKAKIDVQNVDFEYNSKNYTGASFSIKLRILK